MPCYNEELTIAQVVADFGAELSEAIIYVYDNASTDGTVVAARAAGAVVRSEPLKGKGNVVRRMFADIDADIYVLVDGDATYDSASVGKLVQLLTSGNLDMVNGIRVAQHVDAYRAGHKFGNRLLTGLVASLFGRRTKDMLSGYRVFSRRFVKSFPALSEGFEIETELTVHALELRMPIDEWPTPYVERPDGSESKLRTYRDGFRILLMIINLLKLERPLLFFSVIGGILFAVAGTLAISIFLTYFETELVPRLPTAILSTGLVILAMLSCVSGLILDTVTRARQEFKRLVYLSIPAIGLGGLR